MLIAERRGAEGAGGSNPEPRDAEARTRDRQPISGQGPPAVAALTSWFGWTPAPPRRHLGMLAGQGAFEERTPADAGGSGRGRSDRAYLRSGPGHTGVDNDYDEVAASTLRIIEEHPGTGAVGRFARKRSARFEARSAAQLATAGEDVANRADTGGGAERRRCRHFHPSRRSGHTPGRWAAAPRASPVQQVANQFPAFCDAETDGFPELTALTPNAWLLMPLVNTSARRSWRSAVPVIVLLPPTTAEEGFAS